MSELKRVIREEEEAMRGLLSLLDKQFKLIMDKDVFGLEAVVEEIKDANKILAEKEVSRRKHTGGDSMQDILNREDDSELEDCFRKLKRTIEEIKLQKETNEMLIKQQISFNNKLLTYINPRREANTYNSYGNIKR